MDENKKMKDELKSSDFAAPAEPQKFPQKIDL
jgi:hypothetical protein